MCSSLNTVHQVTMIMCDRQSPLSSDSDPLTMSADNLEDNALALTSDVFELHDALVTSVDDIFGDTSHINEDHISDLLLGFTSMDQMSTSTMMENSSFQVRDVIATVSDATSTSCSLDTLPSIQEASSNFKVTNSNETTVTGTISVVHSHEKNLGTPSTAMFVPDPTTTDKQDACSEVKRERPIVQPIASSTSPQNEEYWVLPPKRKPGRKPSRPGQPKRNSQLEEKGSMEYLLKRARNNIAIRKCREKAKSRQEETDKMLMQLQLENSQLKKENSELKHSLAALQKELDILKKR